MHWVVHPLRPRNFPWPSRCPSGFALGTSLGPIVYLFVFVCVFCQNLVYFTFVTIVMYWSSGSEEKPQASLLYIQVYLCLFVFVFLFTQCKCIVNVDVLYWVGQEREKRSQFVVYSVCLVRIRSALPVCHYKSAGQPSNYNNRKVKPIFMRMIIMMMTMMKMMRV